VISEPITHGTAFAEQSPHQSMPGYDPGMDAHDAMQPAPRDTRLTYEDFLLFPDDGRRHEIIDGEHYVTPSPNTRHQELVGRLYFELALYLRDHRQAGRVFLAPFDVVFTRWDVVEPDLLLVAGDQTSIITDKNVQGAPALVVEILSPGTRKTDEQVKRRLFDRGGVREYWLVDPELELIKVFRRQVDGSFRRDAELTREVLDVLTTPLLEGFTLHLHKLFAFE
jgi:Uma2 family endonuclease